MINDCFKRNANFTVISGSDEITIDEIGEINEHIQNETGNSANIIMGVGEDLDLGNNISVTVIATGFGDEKQQSLVNSETKKVIYTLDEDHPFENKLIEEDLDDETELIEEKSNDESPHDFQQKKIESEINEILRNIEISYEVVETDEQLIDINEIEIIDFEHVLPEDVGIIDNQENNDEISFGLFSNNLDKEVINNNDFEENNVDEQTSI